MFANKEQVLNFILSHTSVGAPVRLSHYDFKFMANLQVIIQDKNEITSNQAKLFDALLSKYKKQLTIRGLDKEQLKKLPWLCEVIESLPQFSQAQVDFDQIDDLLTINLPYKKEFINRFRTDYPNNPWLWNKARKRYEAKWSTYALMIAREALPKYFPVVYKNTVKDIMDEAVKLFMTATHWSPTYIKRDGKFMIAATNPVLNDLTSNLVLDDRPSTLTALAEMGIKIDESVHNNDAELMFYSEYISTITITDLDADVRKLFMWLVNLGITNLVTARGSWNNHVNKSFTNFAHKYNINLITTKDENWQTPAGDSVFLSFVTHTKTTPIYFKKIINVINQQEVSIA